MAVIGPITLTGGLASKSSYYSCPKDQCLTYTNVEYRNGSLFPKGGVGSATVVDAAHRIAGSTSNFFTSSATTSGYVLCGGTFYRIDNNFSKTSLGSIFGSFTACNASFKSLNNYLLIPAIDQASQPYTYDGASLAANASAPAGACLNEVVNSFYFVSGKTSAPSRVYWSNVADPLTWTAANTIDFRAGDGDFVTGLSYIGNDLYIFKRYSIGRLSTQTQIISGAVTLGPLMTVVVGIGCGQYNALDRLPDGRIAFLGSDNHAYIFDGSNCFDISDQEYPASNFQGVLDSSSVFTSPGSTVCTYPLRNEVWFSVQTAGLNYNDTVGVYNYKNNIWQEYTTPTGSFDSVSYWPLNQGIATFSNGSTFASIGNLIIGNSVGEIYIHDVLGGGEQRSQTPIFIASTSISLGGEYSTFIPRSIIAIFTTVFYSATIDVRYSFDNGSQTQLISASQSSSSTSLYKATIKYPSTRPHSLQIHWYGSELSPFRLESIYLSDEVIK